MVTHYAYPSDSTPDPNSAAGVGNHDNPLTAYTGGSAPASAALTTSAAQQYGVQLNQSFSVTDSAGNTFNLVYADTAPETVSRIDIYDPNGLLGGNNFSSTATSVTDGTMTTPSVNNGAINMSTFSMNPATWASTKGWIFCYLLSLIALALMVIITVIQNIAYLLMVAVSPITIGFLRLPALAHISTRFFTSLLAICLWPLGWILSDLVTKLILTAVIAASSSGNALTNAVGMGYSFGGWVLLALWVIVSSILAPLAVSRAIVSGGTGIGQVLLGAGAAGSFLALRGGPGVLSAVMSGGSVSAQSNALNHLPAPRFARRPMYSRAEQES